MTVGTPSAVANSCRNCGASATGDFCPVCGQETQIKLPTARVFLREATGRYMTLDGRMWRTLAALLLRPGFLTRQYLLGRRRRYIRPARLFLVLSLALFAAIRFFATAPVLIDDEPASKGDAKPVTKAEAKPAGRPGAKSLPTPAIKFDDGETGGDLIDVPGFKIHIDRDFNLDIPVTGVGWTGELKKRVEHFNRLDRQEKSEQIFFGAVRYGPYAMFVLMPAFAFLMLIAYAGRGRPG